MRNKNLSLIESLIFISCLFSLVNTCDWSICSPSGGICREGNICECKKCFTSWNGHECNYEKYSANVAGVLELFFPIGVGHFYIGKLWVGVIKMLLAYLLLCGIYALATAYYIYTFARDDRINERREGYELFIGYVPGERPRGLVRNATNVFSAFTEDSLKIKTCAMFSQFFFIILHILDLILLFSSFYRDGNNIELC